MPVSDSLKLNFRKYGNKRHIDAPPGGFDVDRLIMDVDDFLGNVDRVYRLVIAGEESLLCPELYRLISHLINQDKIDMVNLISAGSFMPGADMLQLLKSRKIMVTISSFPAEPSPGVFRFIDTMKANRVNFIVKDIWRDLNSFNPAVDKSPRVLKRRFAGCLSKGLHNLINGQYHLCPRAANIKQAGHILPDNDDSIMFRDSINPSLFRKRLRKLLKRDYLAACGICEGSHKETIITELLRTLSGGWYNEYIYYKYRIHKLPPWKQDLARLFFVPSALLLRLGKFFWRGLDIPRVEMPITTRCNLRCRDC